MGLQIKVKREWIANKKEEYREKFLSGHCTEQQLIELADLEKKVLSQTDLKPWERVNLETFDSKTTLFTSYLTLFGKIIQSYSELICYVFMIASTMSNGGLLYMVYPLMIFGYALCEESKPGATFWYFVVIYTQIVILLQFTVQLTLWQVPTLLEGDINFLNWTLSYNLGLVFIVNFSFWSCLAQFIPEILIIMSVLVHIQGETLAGLFDVPPYRFETFEEGLRRYTLNLLSKNEREIEKLQRSYDRADVIQSKREDFHEYKQERLCKSEFDMRELLEKEFGAPPVFLEFQEPRPRSLSAEAFLQSKEKSGWQKIKTTVVESMRLSFDNKFFDRLFPRVKQ